MQGSGRAALPHAGRLPFRAGGVSLTLFVCDLNCEARASDLEGIVAERKLSIYKDGGNDWLKIKNRNYSQAKGRRELFDLYGGDDGDQQSRAIPRRR
jgi:hypothetical protein